jgi:hypothetical protein
MKAKADFVVRNVVDEYVLMPTNDNIGRFNGTVLLNEVSAFVWGKLQQETTQEEILEAILQEYEVPRQIAAGDLKTLLDQFTELGLLEV